MSSDIILGVADVVISANVTKTTSTDFILDAPSRRRQGKTPKYRRALVHDANDGLTLNFNQDYPGGITLLGVAGIEPLPIPHVEQNVIGNLQKNPNLVIRGGIQFEWEEPQNVLVGVAHAPQKRTVSLQDMLANLLDRVAKLEKR